MNIKTFLYRIFFQSLNRKLISNNFIKGTGIEIGALHNPLFVNKKQAKVLYVDRMSVKDLREQYPELNDTNLVEPHYITDGETLTNIDDSTQDFVIANHFLEHCQNPILTIKNMLRVLKKDGILYLAIPDKRFTFDIDRPITTIEHLLKDYDDNGESSKLEHFREWVTFVDKVQGEKNIQKSIENLINTDYSIHYHVWTYKEIEAFLIYLIKNMNFPFEIIKKSVEYESIYILRKI